MRVEDKLSMAGIRHRIVKKRYELSHKNRVKALVQFVDS